MMLRDGKKKCDPALLVSLLSVVLLLSLSASRFQEVADTNILRIRLERAIRGSTYTVDTNLLNFLQSQEFVTENPRVAWLGGYYILSQTGSYPAAKRLWAMSPVYSAKILAFNSQFADDKTKALVAATVASELDSSSLEVRRALVYSLIANERWSEASHELDTLLSLIPDDPDLNAMRGLVEYKSGGSVEKAEQLLLRAKALDPKWIPTYSYLDNFYRNYGTLDQVEEVALEGLSVSLESKSLYSYNFEGSLVDVYLRQEKLDKIPPYLDSGLRAFPQDPWWNALAGDYYLKRGSFAQAVQHFSVTVKTTKDPSVFVGWGDSYKGLGDQANALRAYCQALAIDPAFSPALKRLAEIEARCP
ncbi:MAG: hypothetical protein C0401_11110 [Anaerolinea sp.]|nr:hypothetical protein [Anaerolinea sp.]